MRPSAPPLLFWKVSASTTCSRVALPILTRTRPMGRALSSLIGGMVPGAGGAAAPAAGAPGVAGEPGGRMLAPAADGARKAGAPPAVGGRNAGAEAPGGRSAGAAAPGARAT